MTSCSRWPAALLCDVPAEDFRNAEMVKMTTSPAVKSDARQKICRGHSSGGGYRHARCVGARATTARGRQSNDSSGGGCQCNDSAHNRGALRVFSRPPPAVCSHFLHGRRRRATAAREGCTTFVTHGTFLKVSVARGVQWITADGVRLRCVSDCRVTPGSSCRAGVAGPAPTNTASPFSRTCFA